MPTPPLVALRAVSVHLAGQHALGPIDWVLHTDQHWAFSGSNGSGKSTLLSVIAGRQWIDPDGGERVYCFDGSLRGAMAARSQIGVVSPELHESYVRLELPITGRDVIASGLHDTLYVQRDLDRGEARTVDECIARFDLETIAQQPVRTLSFGELRRALIARALVRRPRIIVLDEYTSGLDERSRAAVLAMVQALASDTQLVIASHRVDDIVAAVTHRLQLDGGRVVGSGAASRIQSTSAAANRHTRTTESAQLEDGPPLVTIAHADVYRSTRLVLRDLSWSISRGEHTLICGPNGSGKSTLAAVIAGTLAPAFGAEIQRSGTGGPFDLWRIKATIAHLSEEWQTGYTVDHTVEEVVLSGFASSVGLFHLPDAAQRERARALLDAFALASLARRSFSQLSFGERRKVLIARALVVRPTLLVLDEIWNGLDAAFRARFDRLLATLTARGTTLVVIAHHAGDAPSAIVRRQELAGGRLGDA